jgi:hypothetical protein
MNSENIKKVTNQAIEQLITALNEGRSETLTQYLAAIGRFHRYSLRNVMLIASQKPAATHVAGFHTWHKLGRFVKKGEKGILILAPLVRRKNESAGQNETDESSTAVGFRATYVFDISQTDGQELPGIGSVNGDPRDYRERLAKFVIRPSLRYSRSSLGTALRVFVSLEEWIPTTTIERLEAFLAPTSQTIAATEVGCSRISAIPRDVAEEAARARGLDSFLARTRKQERHGPIQQVERGRDVSQKGR